MVQYTMCTLDLSCFTNVISGFTRLVLKGEQISVSHMETIKFLLGLVKVKRAFAYKDCDSEGYLQCLNICRNTAFSLGARILHFYPIVKIPIFDKNKNKLKLTCVVLKLK